ncbi:cytidine deaminase-like protein [Aspergillus granulosus]|uniref:Cytidine deaminase-like protein n=1 Tax=Aspergillus granulosus TaxID=176169 RepID=A0ABR4GSE2_9EURO
MPSLTLKATIFTILTLLTLPTSSHSVTTNATLNPHIPPQSPFPDDLAHPRTDHDKIPRTIREYWMRQTLVALNDSGSPCPFYPFGAVVVNHTNNKLGELICTGVNQGRQSGNMMLHGEVSTILNCTSLLQDPNGKFKLSPAETIAAFQEFSLYTNAESCPMCASAIRWNGFKEYIYGTSIETLVEFGFAQITISSEEIFAQAEGLPSNTSFLGGVLTEETDALFAWQFNDSHSCPRGCQRDGEGSCGTV